MYTCGGFILIFGIPLSFPCCFHLLYPMLFHSCVWRSNQSILKEINLIIHWKD